MNEKEVIENWILKYKKKLIPKNYTHFDRRVSIEKVKFIIGDKEKVSKYGFNPFIHYTQKSKKYDKIKGKKEKKREICYSAHLDRYIYQYYSHKLNDYYNSYLKKELEETKENYNIIAYRNNLEKNNINFSKKVIDFLREKGNSFVIVGDFTNFFDNLNHKYLKKMLCKVMKMSSLPEDYFNIYKNITRYSVWDLENLLEINGLKNTKKDIQLFNKKEKAILKIEDFDRLKKSNIKINKEKGIPQGSAISAVLSNIYMIEFDEKMISFINQNDGLYMRYSDDFIIIIPKEKLENFNSELNKILTEIKENIESIPDLELQKEKTKVFLYSDNEILSFETKNKTFMSYLGFDFDGKKVSIRGKTISKYYYRMNRKIKTILKNKGITKKGNKISCRRLYEKYSIKGIKKGNFISYVYRATGIFDDREGKRENIKRDIENHMKKIRKKLNKIK